MSTPTLRSTFAALTLSAFALASSACMSMAPYGSVYNKVTSPHSAVRAEMTGAHPGPKKGQACAMGIAGVAAWGDMSIEAAKKNAGITEIDTLDYTNFSILGVIYMKACTVVTGH